jgi:predicted GNAT family N-acyltransferase
MASTVFIFEMVPHKSERYWEATRLRDKILRIPLGRKLSTAELEGETQDQHLVCINSDKVVASLTLSAVDAQTMRARQVAVDEHLQNKRIGSRMMAYAEGFALGKGYHKMILHARETAVEFYLNLGYAVEGERFEEVGMGHFVMYRILR